MNLEQYVEWICRNLAACEAEVSAFEAEIDRGRDIFECTCAVKYYQGRIDALVDSLEVARTLAAEEAAPLQSV
ncbi:hypothetical protein GC176_01880 [bacterium]|nr:hypothetical protein [bacterium]